MNDSFSQRAQQETLHPSLVLYYFIAAVNEKEMYFSPRNFTTQVKTTYKPNNLYSKRNNYKTIQSPLLVSIEKII